MSNTAERPDDLMGLSDSEYDTILDILGRAPNITELGIFSVMWSEHCSYKSSKFWLKTCLLYTSPSPRDRQKSRMPSSA